MSDFLGQLEYQWFADRTASSNKIGDMKREYYASKIGRATDTQHTPLPELERRWLQSVAGTNSNSVDQLWLEACAAEGVTAGISTSERKRNFFHEVTTSP